MLKRMFDLILSVCALCVFLLPCLLIAIVVRTTSKGPALYWSMRIGKDSQPFMMPKFRTMLLETPEVATDKLSSPQSFLTPVGGFLRKTSLDEIPQLYSVLAGDMSLVGPRPALFNQDALIAARKEMGIDKIRPGITGWAQINGRDDISDQLKIQFDYEYCQNAGIMMDVKIIFLTILSVLRSRGIKH